MQRLVQRTSSASTGDSSGAWSSSGHGSLARHWVSAALHVHRTADELLDCILAHMQHSISPAIAGKLPR